MDLNYVKARSMKQERKEKQVKMNNSESIFLTIFWETNNSRQQNT